MFFRLIFILVAFVLSWAPRVWGSCGASICAADTLARSSGGSRWLELAYEFEYVDQDRPRVWAKSGSLRQVRGHHDEIYTVTRLHRLKGVWAATERWIFEAALPYVSRSHQHIHRHAGQDLLDTWNLKGLGDFSAGARWLVWNGDNKIRLIGQMKFPTGARFERNEADLEAELPVQPGSGSFDYTFGMAVARDVALASASMPVFLSGTYRFNGRGNDEYQIGDIVQIHAGAAVPLVSRLRFLAQGDFRFNHRDFPGRTREEINKTGGMYFFASPGLEWRGASGLAAFGQVQVPVYQWVRSIQLTSAYNLIAGVSYRFAL